MPKKVRAFRDNLVGSWNIGGVAGGKYECEWNLGKNAVIGNRRFKIGDIAGSGSDLWYWDGESEDGVIASLGRLKYDE